MPSELKTLWDIEKEKKTKIYAIFAVLIFFYFFSFFIIWLIIKFLLYLRISLEVPHSRFVLTGSEILLILAIALILAIVHWFYTNHNLIDKILKLLNAKAIDKNDRYHYVFRNVVDEICIAAGKINVETYVIPTIAMNAFAIQDIYGRNVIGITEGLVSRLNRDELQAVLAHEMAHIASNDSLLTTVASSLFGIYNEILNGIVNRLNRLNRFEGGDYLAEPRRGNELTAGLFAAPLLFSLFIMSILSQLLYVFISREKEYRADINAIKYTRNPLSLASALYKIAIHYRGAPNYLSPIFILSPEANPLEEREGILANLFSTHPPFSKRLQTILDHAHAEISEIKVDIYRRPKRNGSEYKTPPDLFVKKENDWFGPYTILQLQTLDWLSPESEIKIGGDGEAIKADDIPYLNHYFKTRDNPIWKLHRLCPICNEWLIPQEYEGFYIWRCAFCDGLLVEKNKLPRIIVRRERGFSEEVKHIASLICVEAKKKRPRFKLIIEIPDRRKCPKCGKPMIRKFYSYAYHIEIDECADCNLIWFDKNELEILQCLIEMEEKDGKR